MAFSPEERAGVAGIDCKGTRALVTGSTSGIGRAAALALARLGADVIVHGRDEAAGAAVRDDLESIGVEARFVAADFADIDAVQEVAATVREETDGLDVLLNNAGGLFREARLADRGIEYTFQVNHLAPYLLTAELLDHFRSKARIVTTASAAHRGVSLDLDRIAHAGSPRAMNHSEFMTSATARVGVGTLRAARRYGRSKLANVLFAAELARRLTAAGRAATSNSVHPGAIPKSGFGRSLPGPLTRLLGASSALPGIDSVADGAAALLFLAVSPRTEGISGRYFAGRTPALPSAAARDPEAAERLWRRSADLLGIEVPLAEHGRGR